MPECNRCGCDPSPAERHRNIEQCYEALKLEVAHQRLRLMQYRGELGAMTEEREAAEAAWKLERSELLSKIPGPLRPKKKEEQA